MVLAVVVALPSCLLKFPNSFPLKILNLCTHLKTSTAQSFEKTNLNGSLHRETEKLVSNINTFQPSILYSDFINRQLPPVLLNIAGNFFRVL